MSSTSVVEVHNLKSFNVTNVTRHNYCFVTGRHGELLYLKLGAAWFCFGLLIHSILSISYQIVYIRQNSECADYLQLVVDIMFPIYSLFILFFIFKYCNLVINCRQSIARILLMHAIGTTLAFWVYSVVNETVNAIALKRFSESKNFFMEIPGKLQKLFFRRNAHPRSLQFKVIWAKKTSFN